MIDFEIQKFSRRCARSDCELQPGDEFYSELIVRDGQVVRCDYAATVWTGPEPQSLGWWRSRVPDPRANRMQWAPSDVMLHYFLLLLDDPGKADTCYVMALLLIRRRVFRLEATEHSADGGEVLLIYCARNETEYRVPVVQPTAARIATIQAELAALLFAGADSNPAASDRNDSV